MILVALFARVGFGEPANLGDHVLFRLPSRQNRRPATNGLGKTFSNSFIIAIPQGKAGITPKPATHGRLWEIPNGTRLSWRSRFFPTALVPKPARDVGKFHAEPVYHGDSARKSGDHAKTDDLRSALWEKHWETRLSWRFPHEKAALTPKPATRDRPGEISSGNRLSWRSPKTARSDWRSHSD